MGPEARGKDNSLAKENLCKSKFYGGVDFRDFDAFNLAMLAKQAWRLLTDSSSLLFF